MRLGVAIVETNLTGPWVPEKQTGFTPERAMIENLPGFFFSDRFGRPTAANLKSWHAPVIMARMTLLRMGLLLVWLAMPDPCLPAGQTKSPSPYFAIHVVDAETGRGVPMVELQTTSSVRYYTDSNGLVAFAEPGLMNQGFGSASRRTATNSSPMVSVSAAPRWKPSPAAARSLRLSASTSPSACTALRGREFTATRCCSAASRPSPSRSSMRP